MDMLRGVVDRHEDDRAARALQTKNRQAKDAAQARESNE
jgi:hypothetical protein